MVDQVNDLIDPMEPIDFGAAPAPMDAGDSGVEDEDGPPELPEGEDEDQENVAPQGAN